MFVALGATLGTALVAATVSHAADDTMVKPDPLPAYVIEQFGPPPSAPGTLDDDALVQHLRTAFIDSVVDSTWREPQEAALDALVASGDPRAVWPMSDLMRFVGNSGLNAVLADAASQLLGIQYPDGNIWGRTTDHLM
ncbi:MAG: hypothetical protein AAF460_10615, partial [Pseudomonadota bacterium]